MTSVPLLVGHRCRAGVKPSHKGTLALNMFSVVVEGAIAPRFAASSPKRAAKLSAEPLPGWAEYTLKGSYVDDKQCKTLQQRDGLLPVALCFPIATL